MIMEIEIGWRLLTALILITLLVIGAYRGTFEDGGEE